MHNATWWGNASYMHAVETFWIYLQEEAKQANEAAHHAQGAAYAAQQHLSKERTRAQELQVRCFQAEEQCAKLVMEIQSLHTHADSREAELTQWQQTSLGPDNRQRIVELIGKLFTRCAQYDRILACSIHKVKAERVVPVVACSDVEPSGECCNSCMMQL